MFGWYWIVIAFGFGIVVAGIIVSLYCEQSSIELAKLDKIYKLYASARSDLNFMSDVGKILEIECD